MSVAWWPACGESVQVLATEELWGTNVATVAVPSTSRLERVAADELLPAGERPWSHDEVGWRAAWGRSVAAMAGGEPIAVARGRIQPLPHQLFVLERAMEADPVRLLFADEVGLGKTIEVGLTLTELKARGLVRRCLVVAPKGIQLQWVAEMEERFGEQFVLVGAGGIPVDAGIDPWRTFDQVVCSLDAVKPVRARPGWSAERVARYNQRRVDAIVEAGWDLVVIDEAHHVAGSGQEVARHQLGRRLAEAAPRLLLLSATPHSGKSDAMARLLGLLDSRFLHGQPLERAHVAPLVVRTEKRRAVDNQGGPLFQPRSTRLVTVNYGGRHIERRLYDAVTEYVRHGYRKALSERRPAAGFLVLLMQRLVSSSTAAVLAALERRLVAVTAEVQQLRLFSDRASDWSDMTGEEQLAALDEATGAAWQGERREVELLVDLARKAFSSGIDAKARHLLGLLGEIARQDGDSAAKAVVFTEFIPTQAMLLDVLSSAGIPAVAVNGTMSIEERRDAQRDFADQARVLVSTDAGGEGVNLQFAHVVVNYDLPWSPTKVEQRIGRVDRIGQSRPVLAFNLVTESSIDARVVSVLEEKLQTILADVGIDKTSDVLAGASAGVDDLYATAILEPDRLTQAAESLYRQTRQNITDTEPLRAALGAAGDPAPSRRPGRLGHWLTLSEQAASRIGRNGHQPGAVLPGEAVPCLSLDRPGWWTMWEVSAGTERTCVAFFVTDNGAVRPDLAEHVWISLAESAEPVKTTAVLDPDTFTRLRSIAADHAYRSTRASIPNLTLRLVARAEP